MKFFLEFVYIHHGPLFKQNTINGDLLLSKIISSNFDEEIALTKEKFTKADYPLRFINNVINEFQKVKNCRDESLIIKLDLFEITKPYINPLKYQMKINQNIF